MNAPPVAKIERGKRKVLRFVGGLFLVEVVGSLYSLFTDLSLQALDVVIPVFLLGAGFAIYRGRNWARWALVLGIGISAITMLMFAFLAIDAGGRSAYPATIIGILELTVAVFLLTSSDVAALAVRHQGGTS